MKRKRGAKGGYKKGKKSKPSVANEPTTDLVSVTEEDNICSEEPDDGQVSNGIDTEQPPMEVEGQNNKSKVDADQPSERSIGKGHARVKVKLRSSMALERHRSSDVQTLSDTDKSNPQVASDKLETVNKDDSFHSDGQTPQMQSLPPKKANSIKIKTSRGIGLSNESVHGKEVDKMTDPPKVLSERGSDNERTADSPLPKISQKEKKQKKEKKKPYLDPRYNEKELIAALEVIRKVMKMEAAGPFNVPVDPVALSIPDYFDIIDTPMDFGSICHNLEHSHKYMNSGDVFKDVQYIWDNCYKYNNKGDYIVDLMKRVKKNFMKYWTAAGLYSDVTGATENNQIEDVSQYGQEKVHQKTKSKHKRRRYGIEHHKSDCLCAVCVVRRRRKEREEDTAVIDNRTAVNSANVSQQYNQEEGSPTDNLSSHNASSSLDRSLDTDANAEVEEAQNEERIGTPEESRHAQAVKPETMDNELGAEPTASGSNETSQHWPVENRTRQSDQQPQGQEIEETQTSQQDDDTMVQEEEEEEEAANHHPHAEKTVEAVSTEKSQQINTQDDVVLEENHSLLQICRSLFPVNVKSPWNGPHSLYRHHFSTHEGPIHAAVAEYLEH